MNRRSHRDQPSEAELAAFADGSLAPEKRARVEHAVAQSAELQNELHLQRRALAAIDVAAGEHAPAALRARVALARPQRQRVRRLPAVAGGAAVALAATVAAIVVLAGSPAGAPSVADASVVGLRPAVAGVREGPSGSPALAQPRAGGLRFPYWQGHFPWRAVGSRRDVIGGRQAVTVFYRHKGELIAYTIVGGEPLPLGARSSAAVQQGITFHTMGLGPRRVVTWVRDGHTCIVTASSTTTAKLLRLAAWNRGGAVGG